MEDALIEQIAFELKRGAPGDVAFLASGVRVWYARYSGPRAAPRSPVVDLVQAVYDHDPGMARKILRSRIYSTAKATEMCHGIVRVAAKRLTDEVAAKD